MSNTEAPEQILSRSYNLLASNLSNLNQGNGVTDEVFIEVFYYTRCCIQQAVDPVERLSDEEQTNLTDGLIQALPTMDSNLSSLMHRFGGEILDEGRFTISGRQYLLDEFLPKLKISQEKKEILKKGLDDLAVGDNFEDMSSIINNYKMDGGPPRDFHDAVLNLRGVPENHSWYSDLERDESRRAYGE